MSTTMITLIPMANGLDRYAVVTVREDDAEEGIRAALAEIDLDDMLHEALGDDDEPDDVVVRATIASHLRGWELTLQRLQYCEFAKIGLDG